jgi:tetratricopeptide (TPR) repeat protein
MQKVKTYTNKIVLPTYKLGGEDLEPALIREFTPRCDPIYPYTTQEKLSQEKEDKEYEAVILENDFLKLIFLPELNGRLYSAYDKINDSEMFYANPVIKPALFALRGAWPAVGVEFNFPNSHTTTTLDRVLCKTQAYDDGSASVTVGDIENTCRMAWSVEIKLSPDSARIEMETKLYNPSDLSQRYYYWINAACPLYGDTQFIYPPSTQRLYTHPPMDASRLGYLDYPVHEGTDISMFKNIKQHFPIFAENMSEDFYGIYHHNLDCGLVHVADHSIVRGRKVWMFGNARDGKIFIDLLSDDAKDYCELQTGPFPLQSDYRMLQAGETYIQHDCWFPVAQTGGFNVASKEFAANVKVVGQTAQILLYPTETLENITVSAIENDSIIAMEKISFRVGHKIYFELPASTQIRFSDSKGQVLAKYGVVADISEENNNKTTTSKYLQGKYLEEQGYRDEAAAVYASANDTQSKLAEVRIAIDCGKNKTAMTILKQLLKSNPENPEALLYFGRLKRATKLYHEAEKAFSKVVDTEFRAQALYEIAVCAVMQQDYLRTHELLQKIVDNDTEAQYLALYALCLRKLEKSSKKIFIQIEKTFSFAPLALGEFILNEKCDVELKNNPQIIFEIICNYIQLDLFDDALSILEKTKINLPLSLYYSAWLNEQLGKHKQTVALLKSASESDWQTDFVFRNESEKILTFAIQENPADSNALYHLGCLMAYKNRVEEALLLWQKVKGINQTNALRNCGLYYWKHKDDKKTAVEYYQQALIKKNVGEKTLVEAEMLLEECSKNTERLQMFSNREQMIENDSRLKLSYVKACLANNLPEQASEQLTNGNFSLCEGKMLSRSLYEQVCQALAEKALLKKDFILAAKMFLQATEYPENIGVGKPANNKEAEWFFKAGTAYDKAGNENAAVECFKQGALKGDFLDIDFFPLKNILQEAAWDKIDVRYWKNLIYRMHCFRYLNKNDETKKLSDKIKNYLAFLVSSRRENSDEYIKLNAVLTCECKSMNNISKPFYLSFGAS